MVNSVCPFAFPSSVCNLITISFSFHLWRPCVSAMLGPSAENSVLGPGVQVWNSKALILRKCSSLPIPVGNELEASFVQWVLISQPFLSSRCVSSHSGYKIHSGSTGIHVYQYALKLSIVKSARSRCLVSQRASDLVGIRNISWLCKNQRTVVNDRKDTTGFLNVISLSWAAKGKLQNLCALCHLRR